MQPRTWFIALIVAAAVVVLPGTRATAQTDDGSIFIAVDSPPSLVAGLDVRLMRGLDDITDTACGPLETDPDFRVVPGRQCVGLADGDYAVSVTGVPAGALELWSCVDIVAARTEHDSIPLGGGFTIWNCDATVSPPGVVIEHIIASDENGEIPSFDVDIFDAGGNLVSDSCESDDRRGGVPREWCVPLDPGSYRLEPVDVLAGFRAASLCASLDGVVGPGTNQFTIDDVTSLWFCNRASPFPPLQFSLSWFGAIELDTSWVDAATFMVVDGAGDDVSDRCQETFRSFEGSFISYDCLGLEPGDYTVTFDSVPDDVDVESTCSPVTVPVTPEEALCSYLLISAPTVAPPAGPDDGPPTTDAPDLGSLPDTGTPSSHLALLGFGLFAAGCGLVGASRRARWPGPTMR